MPSIPPRNSRVLQTVDLLKQEILSGALQGALPGEREFAKQLRVGRVTLRAALKILEDQEWITVSQAGVRRKVLKSPDLSIASATHSAEDCKGKVIVTLAPQALADLPNNERLDFARLSAYCSSAGITIRHRPLDLSTLKDPAHRLKEFLKQNPADLYLLQLTTRETQQWFSESNTPCIVLGSAWPGLNVSEVDYDQRALGLHAASSLSRLGHRKAALLYPSPERRGLRLFRDGFDSAAADIQLHIASMEESPEQVTKTLLSLVSDAAKRPSAIILPRIPYVITATSLLPSIGLQVPQDLSLLCLVYDETLNYTHPPVAGYQLHADSFPRAIFESCVDKLMHPSSDANESNLVMPDFVPAPSLGAAPNR